ncbi:MAG: SsrA-binding protein SmpB [Patescibacteria group bacterium]
MPTLAYNKRAKFDYEILEEMEAGLKLTGAETKSAKAGHVSFQGAYVSVRGNEAWLKAMHISPYKPAGEQKTYNPTRDRKLLLHKREIKRLIGKSKEAGLTLVPISLYTKGDLVKLSFGIGRGKKQFEKREAIRKREIDREIRAHSKLGLSPNVILTTTSSVRP